MSIAYKPPGPVARRFMLDRSFVRGLRGPVGSGKSAASCVESLRMMMGQEPDSKNIRRTRGAVIRNTNPMLRTTTLNTWREWLPEEQFGAISMHPPPFEQEIILKLPDRTEVAAEVYFLALDRPEDMRKLLSLELTWAFGNEAREFNKVIVDGITQRLRRFPAMKDGGPTFSGLILDTNAPDDDHWWPIMAGDVLAPEDMSEEEKAQLVKPEGWSFFTQPGGLLRARPGELPYDEALCRAMIKRCIPEIAKFWKDKLDALKAGLVQPCGFKLNPEAENLHNLHPDYYLGQLAGKTKDYIDVYLLNELGATHDGRAVHRDFNKDIHVAKEPLVPWRGVPLMVGQDYGLTPACIIGQQHGRRWQFLEEIVLTDGSAQDLAAATNRVLQTKYGGLPVVTGNGDPSGDNRSQADKKTAFQVMRAAGVKVRPADSNDPELRRGAGAAVLTRMVEGRPAAQFDPSMKVTIAGLAGAWNYKRIHGTAGFQDEPQKNRYSHPCEAWEYLCMAGGEHKNMTRKAAAAGAPQTGNTRSNSNPLARFNAARRPVGALGGGWRRG